ncbi:MAG: serine--tRNA ligase, partial [Chamaesiphon sp.]|nr:serine--tRNA ligase [Chamaesiphon sp.]
MLDIRQIRENPELVQTKLDLRGVGVYNIQPILALDKQQRELESTRSQLQARSNEIGKLVGAKMGAKVDPNAPEVQVLKTEGNAVKAQLSELEPAERELKAQIHTLILQLPNLPSDHTPIGKSEDENVELRKWGDEYIPTNPQILPHWDIGEKLGILNFESSAKIAQSRFVTLIGAGAALERALISFMLDRQIAAGYTEISPPILVNTASLTATGQLPKFAEDSFKCAEDDLWLIPTAEVPVTNIYRGDILTSEQLPIHHCAYTPCFRREAGSAGRDTRGLIRLHQFNKIELVK